MNFETLTDGVGTLLRGGHVEVHGIEHDSRRVRPGDVFVAIPGQAADGERFIEEALRRGAVAVVARTDPPRAPAACRVDDPRALLGHLSARVFGDPTASLRVIGITGTNGKTTTSYLIDAALTAAGASVAVVGTVGYRIGGDVIAATHTTPEADDLQRLARSALDHGHSHLVLEVSSHALVQHRVDACRFSAAVFSNLTQDHLDFHGSMEAYGKAKERLFTTCEPDLSVVHVGDPFGAELAKVAHGRVLTFRGESGPRADIEVERASYSADGLIATVRTPVGRVDLTSPLLGRHNLENAVAALAVVVAMSGNVEAALAGIALLKNVPGRLEKVADPQGRLVLVDYAHTPDALVRALAAVRPLVHGRLLCVFGCGGDRDREKRPLMGRAVFEGADIGIVTSDNPRNEDPDAIIGEILPGLQGARRIEPQDLSSARRASFAVVPDRRTAIVAAVQALRAEDGLLIAGKGHENYQILGHEKTDFSDVVEAARVLHG